MPDPINLHVDGPHSPERTKEIANHLAECIRFLCYATMPGSGGLEYPADVYEVLGSLCTGTGRLPQVFRQIATALDAQAASGTLADSGGADPATVAGHAAGCLGTAARAEKPLTAALQAAQQAITGLGVKRSSGA